LILSWGVFPSTGGSTIIVNSISEAFSPEQLVLAGQQPEKIPDKKWQDFSDIKLYYLNPFIFGISRKPKMIRWLKLFSIMKEVENIVKREKITRIIAIFPDEFYTYVAYRVSKKLSIPYDIWFHNSYLDNTSGLQYKIAKRLQPVFFDTANRLFVMSDGLNQEMKKNYPKINFQTLVHGFKIGSNVDVNVAIKSEKVKFLYSGSLNHSCLDASIRMMKIIKDNPNWELHVFAGNPEFFHTQGITGDNVVFHNFLPIVEFVQRLKEFDIMLLPHGIDGLRSEFEYRTIFPTRTIPLLFSGKPILAHSPKDSFLTDFLIDNKCAYLVTEKDDQKLKMAIDELIANTDLRELLVTNSIIAANQFKVENVAKKIREF
jgi:glycosyltransferase involved in cell wall biosynthesis